MYAILYIQPTQFIKCTNTFNTIIKNVQNYVHLMYTILKIIHNSVYSNIHKFLKNVHNYVYSMYILYIHLTKFLRIFTIMYVQRTQILKEWTKLCVFNVQNF